MRAELQGIGIRIVDLHNHTVLDVDEIPDESDPTDGQERAGLENPQKRVAT